MLFITMMNHIFVVGFIIKRIKIKLLNSLFYSWIANFLKIEMKLKIKCILESQPKLFIL